MADTADLRRELARRAAETHVPEPPIGGLRARILQERRRRVRRTLALVAAACLAVAVTTTVVATRGEGPTSAPPAATPTPLPESLADLGRGPVPELAYAVLGTRTVQVGGRSVAMPAAVDDLVQGGGVVLAGLGNGSVVRIDPASGRVTTVTRSYGGSLVIETDGSVAAWVKADTRATVVVSWLLMDGGENERTFPATPQCCDNPFVIDGLVGGRLIASQPAIGRTWVWDYAGLMISVRPSDFLTRVRNLDGTTVAGVVADQLLVQDPGSSGGLSIGHLVGSRFSEDEHLRDDSDIVVGSELVLGSTDDGAVLLRHRADPGASAVPQERRLRLPAGTAVESARTEPGGGLLLDVSVTDDAGGTESALVRCDAVTGRCEIAADPPGSRLLLF